MKIVLLLIALYVLWWLLRRSFRGLTRPPPKAAALAEPRPMLVCAQCGLHLPADETLPGRGGVFCGEPHRTAFEKAHPPS